MEMKNKIVWVTGASGGIGEALTYRLNQVKSKCKVNPFDIHALPLDLEDTALLKEKADAAFEIFGRIDIIIHFPALFSKIVRKAKVT